MEKKLASEFLLVILYLTNWLSMLLFLEQVISKRRAGKKDQTDTGNYNVVYSIILCVIILCNH